jgi:hypothetical protein
VNYVRDGIKYLVASEWRLK